MSNVEKVASWAYKCVKCGKLYNNQAFAEICCKEYFCEDCGGQAKAYINLCDSCQEKRVYERATKMTWEEYYKEYPKNMVVFGDDYYSYVEDMLESLASDDIPFPNYCFGTTEFDVKIDAEEILQDLLENAGVEDLEFDESGRKEFVEFAKQWNEKYAKSYFTENNKIVILISENMKKEFSE